MKPTSFLAPLVLAWSLGSAHAVVLFADNFNRPDSNDLDASTAGMSGSAAPVTYVETDPLPVPNDETMSRIENGVLLLAAGPNASAIGIDGHNFTDASILAAGGFSVTLDIGGLLPGGNTNDTNFFVGFGVGLSQAQVQGINLDFNSNDGPRGAFGNAQDGTADFYVNWTPSGGGDLQYFTGANGTAFDLNVANPNFTTLRADFLFTSFASGSNVDVEVFWGGAPQFTTSFQWSGSDENYLAISGRNNAGVSADNFTVSTIPEPTVALLGGLGLAGLLRRRR